MSQTAIKDRLAQLDAELASQAEASLVDDETLQDRLSKLDAYLKDREEATFKDTAKVSAASSIEILGNLMFSALGGRAAASRAGEEAKGMAAEVAGDQSVGQIAGLPPLLSQAGILKYTPMDFLRTGAIVTDAAMKMKGGKGAAITADDIEAKRQELIELIATPSPEGEEFRSKLLAWGLQAREQSAQLAAEIRPPESPNQTKFLGISARDVGETLPTAVAPFVAGGIGGLLGGPAGAVAAAGAVGGALEGSAAFTETFDSAKEAGLTDEEALDKAMVSGVLYAGASTALEATGFGIVTRTAALSHRLAALSNRLNKISDPGLKMAAVRTLMASGGEGSTELAQGLAQQSIQAWVLDDWEGFSQAYETMEGPWKEFALGALFGGSIRVGIEGFSPSNYRSAKEAAEALGGELQNPEASVEPTEADLNTLVGALLSDVGVDPQAVQDQFDMENPLVELERPENFDELSPAEQLAHTAGSREEAVPQLREMGMRVETPLADLQKAEEILQAREQATEEAVRAAAKVQDKIQRQGVRQQPKPKYIPGPDEVQAELQAQQDMAAEGVREQTTAPTEPASPAPDLEPTTQEGYVDAFVSRNSAQIGTGGTGEAQLTAKIVQPETQDERAAMGLLRSAGIFPILVETSGATPANPAMMWGRGQDVGEGRVRREADQPVAVIDKREIATGGLIDPGLPAHEIVWGLAVHEGFHGMPEEARNRLIEMVKERFPAEFAAALGARMQEDPSLQPGVLRPEEAQALGEEEATAESLEDINAAIAIALREPKRIQRLIEGSQADKGVLVRLYEAIRNAFERITGRAVEPLSMDVNIAEVAKAYADIIRDLQQRGVEPTNVRRRVDQEQTFEDERGRPITREEYENQPVVEGGGPEARPSGSVGAMMARRRTLPPIGHSRVPAQPTKVRKSRLQTNVKGPGGVRAVIESVDRGKLMDAPEAVNTVIGPVNIVAGMGDRELNAIIKGGRAVGTGNMVFSDQEPASWKQVQRAVKRSNGALQNPHGIAHVIDVADGFRFRRPGRYGNSSARDTRRGRFDQLTHQMVLRDGGRRIYEALTRGYVFSRAEPGIIPANKGQRFADSDLYLFEHTDTKGITTRVVVAEDPDGSLNLTTAYTVANTWQDTTSQYKLMNMERLRKERARRDRGAKTPIADEPIGASPAQIRLKRQRMLAKAVALRDPFLGPFNDGGVSPAGTTHRRRVGPGFPLLARRSPRQLTDNHPIVPVRADMRPIFYSQMLQGIQEIGKKQPRMQASQLLNQIKKFAKADELRFNGIEDYLKRLGNEVIDVSEAVQVAWSTTVTLEEVIVPDQIITTTLTDVIEVHKQRKQLDEAAIVGPQGWVGGHAIEVDVDKQLAPPVREPVVPDPDDPAQDQIHWMALEDYVEHFVGDEPNRHLTYTSFSEVEDEYGHLFEEAERELGTADDAVEQALMHGDLYETARLNARDRIEEIKEQTEREMLYEAGWGSRMVTREEYEALRAIDDRLPELHETSEFAMVGTFPLDEETKRSDLDENQLFLGNLSPMQEEVTDIIYRQSRLAPVRADRKEKLRQIQYKIRRIEGGDTAIPDNIEHLHRLRAAYVAAIERIENKLDELTDRRIELSKRLTPMNRDLEVGYQTLATQTVLIRQSWGAFPSVGATDSRTAGWLRAPDGSMQPIEQEYDETWDDQLLERLRMDFSEWQHDVETEADDAINEAISEEEINLTDTVREEHEDRIRERAEELFDERGEMTGTIQIPVGETYLEYDVWGTEYDDEWNIGSSVSMSSLSWEDVAEAIRDDIEAIEGAPLRTRETDEGEGIVEIEGTIEMTQQAQEERRRLIQQRNESERESRSRRELAGLPAGELRTATNMDTRKAKSYLSHEHYLNTRQGDPLNDPHSTNYREFVITMPDAQTTEGRTNIPLGAHWSKLPDAFKTNIVVHMLTHDKIAADGGKVLFVDEIQSDLHRKAFEARRKAIRAIQTSTLPEDEKKAKIDAIPKDYGYSVPPSEEDLQEAQQKRDLAERLADRVADIIGENTRVRQPMTDRLRYNRLRRAMIDAFVAEAKEPTIRNWSPAPEPITGQALEDAASFLWDNVAASIAVDRMTMSSSPQPDSWGQKLSEADMIAYYEGSLNHLLRQSDGTAPARFSALQYYKDTLRAAIRESNLTSSNVKPKWFLKGHEEINRSIGDYWVASNDLHRELRESITEMHNAQQDVEQLERGITGDVPDMPYKGFDFFALAWKRLVLYAAENGYDYIALNHGEVVEARWGLKDYHDRYQIEPDDVYAGEQRYRLILWRTGQSHVYRGNMDAQDLKSHIGAQLTNALLDATPDPDTGIKTVEGKEIRALRSGHVNTYNNAIPRRIARVKELKPHILDPSKGVGVEVIRNKKPDVDGYYIRLKGSKDIVPNISKSGRNLGAEAHRLERSNLGGDNYYPVFATKEEAEAAIQDFIRKHEESGREGDPLVADSDRIAQRPEDVESLARHPLIYVEDVEVGHTSEIETRLHFGHKITDEWREELKRGLPLTASRRSKQQAIKQHLLQTNGINVTPESLLRQTRRVMQDYFINVRSLQKDIEKAGGRVGRNSNLSQLEKLYYGRADHRIRDMEDRVVSPIVKLMASHGITRDEVDLYLYAQHAKERNEFIRTNRDPQNDSGSGMTDADADAALAAYAGRSDLHVFEQIAGQIAKLREEVLTGMVADELMTEEQAQAWREQYDHYVPLRHDDDDGAGTVRGKGFQIRGRESQLAKGRFSMADSPMSALIAQSRAAIVRGEKNKVGKGLITLARENPDPALWEISKPMRRRVIDKATGLVRWTGDPMGAQRDNVFTAKENGQEVRITIHNPLVARAMKKMGAIEMNGALKLMSRLTRTMSALNTSLSPEFIASNLTRDIQTAMFNAGVDHDTKIAGEVLRGIRPAMRGAWRAINGKVNSDWSRHFWEFREHGGMTGYVGTNTILEHAGMIDKELALAGQHNIVARGGRLIMHTGRLIEHANLAVENSTRLSFYVALRKRGVTPENAAEAAKELTVNFNTKGEVGSAVNAMYMFFNAGLQGSTRMLKAVSTKKGAAFGAGLVSFHAMLAFLNGAALSDEDDDGVLFWDKIPAWEKDTNLILMIPGGRGRRIKIPMPYGYNVFGALGVSIGDMARGKETPIGVAGRTLNASLASFNPFGGDLTSLKGAIQTATPTVGKPWVDIGLNSNFAGYEIAPRRFNDATPDSQRHFNSVWYASREFTEWMNRVTGGDEVTKGWIDISPEWIDHIIDSYGGSALRSVRQSANLVTEPFDDDPLETRQIPIVRRFYASESEQRHQRSYWRNADELSMLRSQARAYRTGAVRPGRLAQNTDPALIDWATKVFPAYRSVLENLESQLLVETDDARGEQLRAEIEALLVEANTGTEMARNGEILDPEILKRYPDGRRRVRDLGRAIRREERAALQEASP